MATEVTDVEVFYILEESVPYHVHAVGCNHSNRYAGKTFRELQEWNDEVHSTLAVKCYGTTAYEDDGSVRSDILREFKVYPCVVKKGVAL